MIPYMCLSEAANYYGIGIVNLDDPLGLGLKLIWWSIHMKNLYPKLINVIYFVEIVTLKHIGYLPKKDVNITKK